MLYPSDPMTEAATMREAMLCNREGIVINIFLLQSWSQTHEDIQFAHRLAETTRGRVFFTAGRDLDRFVVWDYVNRRKSIVDELTGFRATALDICPPRSPHPQL